MRQEKNERLLHFRLCHFGGNELEQIGAQAKNIAGLLKKPGLEIPLQNLITELFRYSFRQHYLNIQAEFIDKKLADTDDQDLHDIVSAEAFTKICEEKNIPVELSILKNHSQIYIDIAHFGKMPESEMENIRNIFNFIEKSLHSAKRHQIISQEQLSERFSSGISLGLLSLIGLGIPKDQLQVATTKDSTHFRVILPFSMFQQTENIADFGLTEKEEASVLKRLFTGLQYSVIEFDFAGNILHVDGEIFKLLNVEQGDVDQLAKLIPPRFFEDIVWGPFSIKSMETFENYRLSIPDQDGNTICLFNISGLKHGNNKVATLWQAVNVSKSTTNFSEGAIFENINIMKIVRPYIPHLILDKAKDCVRKGLKQLPNERKDVTILFADLISFTQKSEYMPHDEVIALLNLTMSTIVQSIERNSGYVDKFIGDGIMCIFMEPLSSIIAGIEIQNNLLTLNEFRKIGGQPPLELRIGINTGSVILGSIGIKTRMDWTALGDVVNTASRIEKVSKKYAVLIGESTFRKVQTKVQIEDELKIKLKGKKEAYRLYYINGATFDHEGKKTTIELNDEIEEI